MCIWPRQAGVHMEAFLVVLLSYIINRNRSSACKCSPIMFNPKLLYITMKRQHGWFLSRFCRRLPMRLHTYNGHGDMCAASIDQP